MGSLNVAKWLLGLVLACGICPTGEAQEIGPPTGALVTAGGAMKDPTILARYSGKFMRRTKSWKRGSERRGSQSACTARWTKEGSRSAYAFSSQ